MLYLIEKDLFKDETSSLIFDTLHKFGLEFEMVDCLPFINDLTFTTERQDVFCFGSVKLALLANKYEFKPGSFFGGNHDYEIYSKYYKENLLNYDSVIQKYTDPIEFVQYSGSYNEVFKFIRPTKDSKIFTGRVFTEEKWKNLRDKQLIPYLTQNELANDFDFNGMIQVCTPKVIWKEARTWIIDGRVVTSSYYRFDDSITFEENVSPEGLEFAQKMADLYQVADAFVMDICFTPDGWKIVEINCINCSGFYKGDLQKIIMALEHKFEKQ